MFCGKEFRNLEAATILGWFDMREAKYGSMMGAAETMEPWNLKDIRSFPTFLQSGLHTYRRLECLSGSSICIGTT